jgi:hypothetical protein
MAIQYLRNLSNNDARAQEFENPNPLWTIVTGLTRLYFTNPDMEALRETIGKDDYDHLLRINRKLAHTPM